MAPRVPSSSSPRVVKLLGKPETTVVYLPKNIDQLDLASRCSANAQAQKNPTIPGEASPKQY